MQERAAPVWDLPVRLFHWGLVLALAGSYASIRAHEMIWHQRFGFLVMTLVVFRLLWGIWGSETARFAAFLRGPRAVAAYAGGLARGDPPPVHGHNPLGALSVLALLAVALAQATLGLFANDDIFFFGPWAQRVGREASNALTSWHIFTGNVLLALVLLHLIAVLAYGLLGRNLVPAMVTGHNAGPSASAPPPAYVAPLWLAAATLALAVAIASAAFRYWLL